MLIAFHYLSHICFLPKVIMSRKKKDFDNCALRLPAIQGKKNILLLEFFKDIKVAMQLI